MPDSDSDGFLDGYEVEQGFNPLDPGSRPELGNNAITIGLADTDEDGLPDVYENEIGTDSTLEDSDDDGVLDGAEILNGLDPSDPSDGEISDSDGDGLDDFTENDLGSNPANQDSDRDSLRDDLEFLRKMDPRNPDSDGDGLLDGWETGPREFRYTNSTIQID